MNNKINISISEDELRELLLDVINNLKDWPETMHSLLAANRVIWALKSIEALETFETREMFDMFIEPLRKYPHVFNFIMEICRRHILRGDVAICQVCETHSNIILDKLDG
jgi:hypothetical protein